MIAGRDRRQIGLGADVEETRTGDENRRPRGGDDGGQLVEEPVIGSRAVLRSHRGRPLLISPSQLKSSQLSLGRLSGCGVSHRGISPYYASISRFLAPSATILLPNASSIICAARSSVPWIRWP